MAEQVEQNGNMGKLSAEPPHKIAQARVDDKGRLKLPANFVAYLQALNVDKVFITTVDLELARIYPLPLWKANEILVESSGDMKEQGEDVIYVAKLYGDDSEIDSQGRVLMPAELRRVLDLESQPVWLECQQNGRINVANKAAHDARVHRATAGLQEKRKNIEKHGFK